MPYEITWEAKGVYIKFRGIVSSYEDDEANNQLYRDPRFEDSDYFIWDMTDVIRFEMADDEIDFPAITDKVATSYKPKLKGALIATDKAVQRIIELYIYKSVEMESSWELKLFNHISDARRWILS